MGARLGALGEGLTLNSSFDQYWNHLLEEGLFNITDSWTTWESLVVRPGTPQAFLTHSKVDGQSDW